MFINKNMKDHPEFQDMSKALAEEEEEHMIAPVPVEQSDWGVPSTSGLSLSQASTSTNSESQPQGTPAAMPELPTLGAIGEPGEDLSVDLKTESE